MIGRFVILMGLMIVALGLVLHFKADVPWLTSWIGKLPGDIVIKKKGITIYLPVATSLLVSLVLSIVFSSLFRAPKS